MAKIKATNKTVHTYMARFGDAYSEHLDIVPGFQVAEYTRIRHHQVSQTFHLNRHYAAFVLSQMRHAAKRTDYEMDISWVQSWKDLQLDADQL